MHPSSPPQVSYWHVHRNQVDYVFVDCWYLYHRPGTPYADQWGSPFVDNPTRWAALGGEGWGGHV